MTLNALGIDLAKSVFQLHGVDARGKTMLSKQVSRSQLFIFVAKLPKCLIGMEACSGAHFWARRFRSQGHEVKLIAPQFVKPYVKSNKSDRADAEAICEALTRPNMRFVSLKSIEQHDMQSLHRIRERLVKERTALINETRGLLAEYGEVLPVGKTNLYTKLLSVVEAAVMRGDMTSLSLELFTRLHTELRELNERIESLSNRIGSIHKNHPVSLRLEQIPGVGPMTATAMVAAVGNPKDFKNGRQFSAWLGLVPKQHSSGGKERLLGISKRGDVYLRKLLVHGARAIVSRVESHPESSQTSWLKELIKRRGINRAVVALANKNARRIWALMTHEVDFDVAA